MWTFHLREGVKWQDGEPFTADDVAFTYNYIVDNEMGAFSSLTTFIEEAVAVDDLTVEIRCSKPKANMIRTWIPILPEHVWSKVSPKAAGAALPEQAAHRRHRALPGRSEVKKGDYVKHGRQPHVLGQEADHRRDPLRHLPEPGHHDAGPARRDARRRLGHPVGAVPQARGRPRACEAIAYNLLTWDYLAMNCYEGTSRGNPVLRDVAFRQALNWAIDRQRIVDLAWAGQGRARHHPHDAGLVGRPGLPLAAAGRRSCSPTTRRRPEQLLDAAGYKDTDGDGVREDKGGKPIKLRLWARSESPESQKTGSLHHRLAPRPGPQDPSTR